MYSGGKRWTLLKKISSIEYISLDKSITIIIYIHI